MTKQTVYSLLETQTEFDEFIAANQGVPWLAFDTEFIMEKRYYPQLCLIQVATEVGTYLIDSLRITDLSGLMLLIESPEILKITHAGENDYRIFYKLFGTLPKNIFDTQIAAGFLSYQYPMSFKDLTGKYLKINLQKGFKVSDWSKRPIDDDQIEYALDDVIYLYDLFQKLKNKLDKLGRFEWVMEECQLLGESPYYQKDPYKELGQSRTFSSLKKQEQVFLVRLVDWRRAEAKRKDMSKNMVLDNKLLYEIAKGITAGKSALEGHRIIPKWVTSKYWATFSELHALPPTPEELAIIKRYSTTATTDLQRAMTMDLLLSLLKYKAMEYNVSSNLIVNRSDLDQMKASLDFFPEYFEKGWRLELLGKELMTWLKNRSPLRVEILDNQWVIAEK